MGKFASAHPVSEATRRAVGDAHRGVRLSAEQRAKIAASLRRHNASMTAEERQKRSVNGLRAAQSPEARAKRERSRQKIVAASITPEVLAKRAMLVRGRPLAAEHRAKIAASVRRPDFRRQASERQKERLADPLLSERIRDSVRRANRRRLAALPLEQRQLATLPARTASLRSHMPSLLERGMADALEALCIRFEPQKLLGAIHVDFYLPDYSAVVECDGDYWHTLPAQSRRDRTRDAYLRRAGYIVIRMAEAAMRSSKGGPLHSDLPTRVYHLLAPRLNLAPLLPSADGTSKDC